VQVKVPVTPVPLCTRTALPSKTTPLLTEEEAEIVQVAERSVEPPGSFELLEQPTTSAASTAKNNTLEKRFVMNLLS
jgi:hypothetical protein